MATDGKENQGLRVGKWKMERGFKGPSRTSGTMIGDNPKSAPSLANKSNIFLASSLEAPGNTESQSSPKVIPRDVAVVFYEEASACKATRCIHLLGISVVLDNTKRSSFRVLTYC